MAAFCTSPKFPLPRVLALLSDSMLHPTCMGCGRQPSEKRKTNLVQAVVHENGFSQHLRGWSNDGRCRFSGSYNTITEFLTWAPAATSTQSQAGPGSIPANPVTRVAPGSIIPVRLTKTIDAKKVKSGDPVVASLTQDLKSNDGRLIFAKDTKLTGHVTEARPRSKEHPESEVGIAFDHAVMKTGGEMQIPLSIQAIIAFPSSNPSNADSGGSGQAPNMSGGGASAGTPGRPSGMGGNSTAPPSTANMPTSEGPSADAQTASGRHAPITANTQGVVGISNLRLVTAAPDATQGSLVSSEKNNVKLESGTMMLLRVNQ